MTFLILYGIWTLHVLLGVCFLYYFVSKKNFDFDNILVVMMFISLWPIIVLFYFCKKCLKY